MFIKMYESSNVWFVCVCVCVGGGVLFLARYFQSMNQIQLIESVQMICSVT